MWLMALKPIIEPERRLGAQDVELFSMLKCDKGIPREMRRPLQQIFFKAILRDEMAGIEDKTRTEEQRST